MVLLGPYGAPRGVGVPYERGTPVPQGLYIINLRVISEIPLEPAVNRGLPFSESGIL